MQRNIETPGFTLPVIEDITRKDFLIGGAAAALLLAGCGSGEQADSPGDTKTVEHAAGTTEVPVSPERIVSLSDAGLTYTLLDIGVAPIGSVDAEGVIRAGENDVSEIGTLGIASEPNVEKIATLEPDLIVGLTTNNSPQYERLSQIAPTVLFDSESMEAQSLFDFHRELADLVGGLAEYEELVGRVDSRTQDLRDRLSSISSELEASAVSIGNDSASEIFVYYGSGAPWSAAFERLGIQLPASMPPSHNYEEEYLSLERVSDFDADAMFILTSTVGENPVEAFLDRPVVASLNAVEKDQTFTVSYDEWQYARVGGVLSVYDDLEKHLLDREIDTSGDFR